MPRKLAQYRACAKLLEARAQYEQHAHQNLIHQGHALEFALHAHQSALKKELAKRRDKISSKIVEDRTQYVLREVAALNTQRAQLRAEQLERQKAMQRFAAQAKTLSAIYQREIKSQKMRAQRRLTDLGE